MDKTSGIPESYHGGNDRVKDYQRTIEKGRELLQERPLDSRADYYVLDRPLERGRDYSRKEIYESTRPLEKGPDFDREPSRPLEKGPDYDRHDGRRSEEIYQGPAETRSTEYPQELP